MPTSTRCAVCRSSWSATWGARSPAGCTAPVSGTACRLPRRRHPLAEPAPEQHEAGVHPAEEVAERLSRARAGGPERHRRKLAEQGKLMPRERLRLLFDEDG